MSNVLNDDNTDDDFHNDLSPGEILKILSKRQLTSSDAGQNFRKYKSIY